MFAKLFVSSAALIALMAAGVAEAGPLTVSGSVGGAPTGATLDNLDALTVGGTSPQTTATGVKVSFVTDAAVVSGSGSTYAAPFLSGGNGTGFGPGGTNQANGADATTYLTTGSTGTFAGAQIKLVLPTLEKYFGLLWGSVDAYNTLSFYAGSTLVGSITGSDVTASPNGNQGVNGTLYVNINSTIAFDTVIATSSSYAFEFDDIAYSATTVPEPVSLALVGSGLIGLAALRRRQR